MKMAFQTIGRRDDDVTLIFDGNSWYWWLLRL